MIKIAITGPESSGKSTLAIQLSDHYDAALVGEYAREYLTGLGREYNEKDLEIISRRQLANESSVGEGKSMVICDTDILVLKVWYGHKFGHVPSWLTESISNDRYDYHLLTYPDIPYEPDPLRENPEKGKYFFNQFRQELQNYQFPFTVIRGTHEERLNKAKKAIDAYINSLS